MSRYALAAALIGLLLPALVCGSTDSIPEEWPLVVTSGVLFVSGERVEAPYVFAVDGDTLRVNRIPILPVRTPERPSIRVTEAARTRHRLLRSCLGTCGHLVDRGVCRSAVRDSAQRFLEASPLVDEVSVHDENSLRIRWTDGPPGEEYMTIPVEKPAALRAWSDVCTAAARHYGDALDRGNIVIVGASGEMLLHGGRMAALERELDALFSGADPRLEDLEILSFDFAREFLEVRK